MFGYILAYPSVPLKFSYETLRSLVEWSLTNQVWNSRTLLPQTVLEWPYLCNTS